MPRRPATVWRAGLTSHADPWWWSDSGEGRFDVHSTGRGALYLGTDQLVGLLEVIGPEMRGGAVAEDDLRKLSVFGAKTRSLPHAKRRLADLTAGAAIGFGITNELSVMTPYTLPQRWACALDAAGFEGIRYRTRFDVRPAGRGLVFFGEPGSNTEHWPTDVVVPALNLQGRLSSECHIKIVSVPTLASLPKGPRP